MLDSVWDGMMMRVIIILELVCDGVILCVMNHMVMYSSLIVFSSVYDDVMCRQEHTQSSV